MRIRPRSTALSCGVLGILGLAVSCREPTQITVLITTGEKCSDLSGVQAIVGPSQGETQSRFEHHYTTTVTSACDGAGVVGTLVVVPGGQGGTILVAAGVRLGGAPAPDPTTCADPVVAKSCIIARRSFTFLDHTSLSLPINLEPLCVGKACDPASTCFRGTCVDATVTCNGTDCGLSQENPGRGDGGANEAGSSDGAYDADLDGMGFEDVRDSGQDGTTVGDAAADANGDGSIGTAPPCGFGGGHVCYSGAGGTVKPGTCANPANLANSCCHCTCPANGMDVTCDTPNGGGASCQPVLCP